MTRAGMGGREERTGREAGAGDERTGGPEPDESPEAREARLRAKNRSYLIVILAVCFVLGALGFAFTRWLFTLPAVAK